MAKGESISTLSPDSYRNVVGGPPPFMRLVTKAAIVLFVLYVGFVAGMAYWMERSVRSVSRSMLKTTARLIGNDIAAVISKSAIEELRLGDSDSRLRLEQTIQDITSRSEVVSSVSVVDSTGKVVASDEMEVGRQVADPDLIFPALGHSDFGEPGLIRQGDAYYIFVPLLDRKKIVGYLRLALNSEPFTVVYSRARRDFLVAGLSGLGGVVVLLVLLESSLRRRATRLIETLEQATANRAGVEAAPNDEFAPVQDACVRLGAQLAAALERASEAGHRFDAAHTINSAALVVLKADKTLSFANQRARDLIGCPGPDELEKRWNEIQALIEDAWETAASDTNVVRLNIDLVDAKPPRALQLQAVELGDDGRSGFAMLVVDRTLSGAIDADLSSSLQLDAIQASCRDAANTLRTLSETIDANLQGLRASLERDEVDGITDRREEQTEFIDTVEDTAASLDYLCKSMLLRLNQRQAPRASFDLRDLFADIISLVAAVADSKRIVVEPPNLSGPLILGPVYRPLRDALLNVVLHILDWMPEGTVVGADVGRTAAQLTITVRCTAASTLSPLSWQLFEPHILDDQGSARIGLGVARAATESLGGEIEVYASPAGGTSYRISVPLAAKATPAGQTPLASAS